MFDEPCHVARFTASRTPGQTSVSGRTRSCGRAVLSLLLAIAAIRPASSQGTGPESDADFRVSATRAIGGEGSWDYADYDPVHHRLFVARVGGVLVLDVAAMRPIGTIPAFAGTRTHGIVIAPEAGIGMTSDGADQTATVFDLESLRVARRIALKHSPDGIVYDPASQRGIAFDGDARVAVVFDPKAGRVTAEVKLPGSPEAAASDGRGSLYVNLADEGEVAVIDTRRWEVASHWRIGEGCSEPTPLAMDRESNRLFVGCRSGVLAIVDPARHVRVASVPIGTGADAVAYDPRSHLIFVACYAGSLSIVREVSPDEYRLVQTVATAPAARTLALDPTGPRVFLPVASLGPQLPPVGDIPSRPAVIPETFRILTVSR